MACNDECLSDINTSLQLIASKLDYFCNSFDRFVTAFESAFNLNNNTGSVFKANDGLWNGDNTLCGIVYKQLDRDYLSSHLNYRSAFFHNCKVGGSDYPIIPVSLPDFLRYIFVKSNYIGENGLNTVFKFSPTCSVTDIFRRSLFSYNNNSTEPSPAFSVFTFGFGSDNNKILNHSCLVNPVNISFCSEYNIKSSLDDIKLSIDSVKTSIDSIDENKTVVNEIIVDENSNVNISKPNYHFDDSDNQGFWGR